LRVALVKPGAYLSESYCAHGRFYGTAPIFSLMGRGFVLSPCRPPVNTAPPTSSHTTSASLHWWQTVRIPTVYLLGGNCGCGLAERLNLCVTPRATDHLSPMISQWPRTIQSHIFILFRYILWTSRLDKDQQGQQQQLDPVTYHALFLR